MELISPHSWAHSNKNSMGATIMYILYVLAELIILHNIISYRTHLSFKSISNTSINAFFKKCCNNNANFWKILQYEYICCYILCEKCIKI